MFTGIIKAKGSIGAIEKRGGDVRLRVTATGLPWADYAVGDSISVNGVCLTALVTPSTSSPRCVSATPSAGTLSAVTSTASENCSRVLTTRVRFE
jgi:riboflavin synthase